MTLADAIKISWCCRRHKYPNLDVEKFGAHIQWLYVCKDQPLKDLDICDLFAEDWEPCT